MYEGKDDDRILLTVSTDSMSEAVRQWYEESADDIRCSRMAILILLPAADETHIRVCPHIIATSSVGEPHFVEAMCSTLAAVLGREHSDPPRVCGAALPVVVGEIDQAPGCSALLRRMRRFHRGPRRIRTTPPRASGLTGTKITRACLVPGKSPRPAPQTRGERVLRRLEKSHTPSAGGCRSAVIRS